MSSPADLPLTLPTKRVLDLLEFERDLPRSYLNAEAAERFDLNPRQVGARLGFLATADLVEFRDVNGERFWRRKKLA